VDALAPHAIEAVAPLFKVYQVTGKCRRMLPMPGMCMKPPVHPPKRAGAF